MLFYSNQCEKWLARTTKNLLSIGRPLLFLFSFVFAAPVAAQSRQKTSGRKVIRLEAIKVEGRIQKPQAFYILQRSNLNFEELGFNKSFLPKIIRSIERKPF